MQNTLKRLTPVWATLLALAALSSPAPAQSNLTTIQDTLFKADGTRFSGTLTIQWSTFDTTSPGTIVQQSRDVAVVNGNLDVQLVPNAAAQAPANVYTVHYQSDGAQQFTETWTVPPNSQPMTVSQVRTGTFAGSGISQTANQTPIVESAVIGLTADLSVRPIKGPGFGTGSVAVINQNGQIETAVGNIGDCVFVDGTTGSCGGQSSSFFDSETPGGLVDGMNTTFTLANPPSGSSLLLFRNGLCMKAGFDYTLTASSLTFVQGAVPQPGDTLVASYRIDPSSGNIGQLQSSGLQTRNNAVLAQVLCSSNGRANDTAAWSSLGSCDIPAAALHPGDRIEIRFNFTHTGTASAFDMKLFWGSLTILNRHASAQDAAVAGQAEAAITAAGAQINIQSWGTLLTFLPAIVSSATQSGVKVDLEGMLSTAGSDSIALSSYTVLRYPAS